MTTMFECEQCGELWTPDQVGNRKHVAVCADPNCLGLCYPFQEEPDYEAEAEDSLIDELINSGFRAPTEEDYRTKLEQETIEKAHEEKDVI